MATIGGLDQMSSLSGERSYKNRTCFRRIACNLGRVLIVALRHGVYGYAWWAVSDDESLW